MSQHLVLAAVAVLLVVVTVRQCMIKAILVVAEAMTRMRAQALSMTVSSFQSLSMRTARKTKFSCALVLAA
jgi:hypothetical protein